MNGTAVEAAPNSGKNVRALLSADAAKARIFPMLPGRTPEDKQAEYDRLVTIIDRATRKEPKLLTCTGTSIIDAAATIVGWNLEIGDTAHLVPFADKATGTTTCVPMMDYKGMAQILVTSGVVRAVEPWCVYENDDFEVRGGTNAGIMHTPVWKGVRGKLIGAYVIFRLKNQYTTFK
ncbi:MAG: recombinase RecT [Gemmatimonadaceae bacterium]